MNANISRAVVVDLWPAYTSGEASADTRALVENFLKTDPELERQLRRDPFADLRPPDVPADAEMRAFARARRRLSGFRPLLFGAMLFSFMAFGRIISDTSFDVSPRRFIATAAVAVILWIAFFISLWRMRGRILFVTDPARRSRP